MNAHVPQCWGERREGPAILFKKKIHSSSLCEIEDFVETHLCKLCVILYSGRAYHWVSCVLIKDIGRRLPLELQCSYQGQQGHVSQSVRGNYKTRL